MAAGIYTAAMTPMRKQTVRLYKQQTESPTGKRLRPPAQHLDSLDGLESAYWRTIPGNTEYGADNEGTLFDKSIKVQQAYHHQNEHAGLLKASNPTGAAG